MASSSEERPRVRRSLEPRVWGEAAEWKERGVDPVPDYVAEAVRLGRERLPACRAEKALIGALRENRQ